MKTLQLQRAIATLANIFYPFPGFFPGFKHFTPGYGKCPRCWRNWWFCREHYTCYTEDDDKTFFVLCEDCWQDLSVEARLTYYRAGWDEWHRRRPFDAEQVPLCFIEEAVRKGY